MSLKNLLEEYSLSDIEMEDKNVDSYNKIYENYVNDIKKYGEEAIDFYSVLLGEELVESFYEYNEMLSEAAWSADDWKTPNPDLYSKKIPGSKGIFGIGKTKDKYKTQFNMMGEVKRKMDNTLWNKIKKFGADIPKALKGFVKQGMDFFKTSPWAGALAAVAAAGITFAVAKKIFGKAKRKLTSEQEEELKKKLETVKTTEEKHTSSTETPKFRIISQYDKIQAGLKVEALDTQLKGKTGLITGVFNKDIAIEIAGKFFRVSRIYGKDGVSFLNITSEGESKREPKKEMLRKMYQERTNKENMKETYTSSTETPILSSNRKPNKQQIKERVSKKEMLRRMYQEELDKERIKAIKNI